MINLTIRYDGLLASRHNGDLLAVLRPSRWRKQVLRKFMRLGPEFNSLGSSTALKDVDTLPIVLRHRAWSTPG